MRFTALPSINTVNDSPFRDSKFTVCRCTGSPACADAEMINEK